MAVRANALAAIDREHHRNALIVADLSHDPSYAESLFSTFGKRVIGLHISRYGDGQNPEHRPVGAGSMLVYTIGRSYLLELFQSQLVANEVRLAPKQGILKAYDQLSKLQVEYRDTGTVYSCAAGQHDDLGISIAMLVWAAKHPYLKYWARALEPRVRKPKPKVSWEAWT